MLLVIIAVWATIAGATQIAAAIRLRKVIRNEWFLALVIAIATFALVWGVVLIVLGFRLRQLGRTLTST